MRLLALVACIFTVIAANGCSIKQNTKYGADLSHIKDVPLVKNQTTEQDLIHHFGQPQNSVTNAIGTETVTWVDNRSTGHATPGDIWFGGRHVTSVTTDTLVATFRDDKLVDYSFSHAGTPPNYQGR